MIEDWIGLDCNDWGGGQTPQLLSQNFFETRDV